MAEAGEIKGGMQGLSGDDVLKHLRAALEREAPDPLAAAERPSAAYQIGSALLQASTADADKAGREVLKVALAEAKDAKDVKHDLMVAIHYDLACAHARLKELDDAFAMLTQALEENKASSVEGIDGHWQEEDDDLAPLRADPRWKPLVEKFGKSTEKLPTGN